MNKKKCVIIFGGTGFIGSFFAKFILERNIADKVYLLDIESPKAKDSNYRKKSIIANKKLEYIFCDVRFKILNFKHKENVLFIANFAAIHREPGHKNSEYFETNILGAQNVCDFAERIKCKQIIFTSSISCYGASKKEIDESTLTSPISPYGSSKLIAEKIHQIWFSKDPRNRFLHIVRPGVVFGPGECGNVSRLIRAVLNHYFIYFGNKNVRKSCIYVKELCSIMWWELARQNNNNHLNILNASMNPPPTIRQYVEVINKLTNTKTFTPSIPFYLVFIMSFIIDPLAKLFNPNHPFSPKRIEKLTRPNDIIPSYLIKFKYRYLYSLEDAFKDWMIECPEDWD